LNIPLFTILLTSHRKRGFVHHAIRSVLAQTFRDFELLILDSGDLIPDLKQYEQLPQVQVMHNGQTDDLPRTVPILSWILNRITPDARGHFITYLCDDDYYHPDYLQTFADAIEPGVHCYWTTIESWKVNMDGSRIRPTGHMIPEDPPRRFHCNQLMMCHSKESALAVPWPMELETDSFADGVLMERLAAKYTFKNVPGVHAVHQRTPLSYYGGPGPD